MRGEARRLLLRTCTARESGSEHLAGPVNCDESRSGKVYRPHMEKPVRVRVRVRIRVREP